MNALATRLLPSVRISRRSEKAPGVGRNRSIGRGGAAAVCAGTGHIALGLKVCKNFYSHFFAGTPRTSRAWAAQEGHDDGGVCVFRQAVRYQNAGLSKRLAPVSSGPHHRRVGETALPSNAG